MIEIQGLTKRLKQIEILKGINLHIKANEKIALIGRNGAGKTTLIRTLLGFYQAEGTVRIQGELFQQDRCLMMQKIGFIPQNSPPLKMRVKDLIKLNSQHLDASFQQNFSDLAEQLELDQVDIMQKNFMELSGGMQQKLMIILALAKKPLFLIMDEPAANIDSSGRNHFFEILKTLTQDMSMLVSSHRLYEILPLVNRVVEIDKGKIISDQSAERFQKELQDSNILIFQ